MIKKQILYLVSKVSKNLLDFLFLGGGGGGLIKTILITNVECFSFFFSSFFESLLLSEELQFNRKVLLKSIEAFSFLRISRTVLYIKNPDRIVSRN